MPWGAAIGAAGVLGGALISSNSAGNAADSQASSSAAAIAEQQRQFDLTRGDEAPYRAAGTQALGQLQTSINTPTTAADVMSDPGYQFGLSQGQLGLDRKAAAAGGRVSGASLKAASSYATDYATTGYNAAYQRGQDRLNRLATLAGIGQTATGTGVAAGTNSANQISGLIDSQGNATGAAQLAQGNIWGNATNQLGAIGQRWANQPSGSTGYSANPGNGGYGMPTVSGYTPADNYG